nr:reverse transcriptase domain-containing protein [Tanacetum cinerariifolium]
TPPGNKKSNGSGHRPLIGSSGEIIWPLGQLSLLVKIRDEKNSTSAWMNFVMVRSSSSYNEIIGGILTLKRNKIIPIECAVVSEPEGQPSIINQAVEGRIKRHRRNIQNPKGNQHEAESQKMHIWVEEEMFLGYKVNTKGIKVRPDKADAVLSLPSLKCLKDVQKLNGKLASLNRFLAKSPEKSLTFFKTLKNFIVERLEEDSMDTPMEIEEELPEPWILFTDGSSCADGSEEGLILTNPEGTEFTYALRFMFEATNNEAEYEALIARLRIVEQMGVKNLQANVDSRLVANQVNETYIAKEAGMIKYLEKVRMLTNGFRMFSIKQVPKSENKKADALRKIISTSFAHLSKQVLVEELKEKSINEVEVLAMVEEEGDTWMTPIYEYLTEEILPARLVERENRSLREGLKARIDAKSKDWVEEISHVLWAHHTMIKSSNGDTHFLLTYGTEEVIPAEIDMPTLRIAKVDMVLSDEALEINLHLLEERREHAAIHEAKSKARIDKYYNLKVHGTSFKPGDFVYRSNDASHTEEGGKLGPTW